MLPPTAYADCITGSILVATCCVESFQTCSPSLADRVIEERELHAVLRPLGLTIAPIPPDGHCLYRSLGKHAAPAVLSVVARCRRRACHGCTCRPLPVLPVLPPQPSPHNRRPRATVPFCAPPPPPPLPQRTSCSGCLLRCRRRLRPSRRGSRRERRRGRGSSTSWRCGSGRRSGCGRTPTSSSPLCCR